MRTARPLLLLTLALALVVPWAPAAGAVPTPTVEMAPMAAAGSAWNKDELMFQRTTGAVRFHDVDGHHDIARTVGTDSLSQTWHLAVPVDVDGDQQDEILLYNRNSGDYRIHDVLRSGVIGGTLRTGTFSAPWSMIRSVDLDGDQQDELLFYRKSSGAYRVHNVSTRGVVGATIGSGSYPSGYAEITAIDLDGDQRDELMVYRSSGAARYVELGSRGALGSTIRTASYSSGWSSITALDVDKTGSDEILFSSKSNRRYAIYNISSGGSLGSPAGRGALSEAWSNVVGLNIDPRPSAHPFVAQIVRLVNEERADAGLAPVRTNSQAQSEALRWSRVMAGDEQMRHRTDLFHGLPSSARYVGENVAVGYTSAASVMAGWMASPGHRANILNPRFTHIGVGVAPDSSGRLYYTQVFFSTS